VKGSLTYLDDDVIETNTKLVTDRLRFRRAEPALRFWVDINTGSPESDGRLILALLATVRGACAVSLWKAPSPADSSEKDVGGVEISGLIDHVAKSFSTPPSCLLVPASLVPNASEDHLSYAARTLGFPQRFSVTCPENVRADESCPRHIFDGSAAAAVASVASFVATMSAIAPAPSSR
jgi:hypothetical protein